jgi:hypothetical protein
MAAHTHDLSNPEAQEGSRVQGQHVFSHMWKIYTKETYTQKKT